MTEEAGTKYDDDGEEAETGSEVADGDLSLIKAKMFEQCKLVSEKLSITAHRLGLKNCHRFWWCAQTLRCSQETFRHSESIYLECSTFH